MRHSQLAFTTLAAFALFAAAPKGHAQVTLDFNFLANPNNNAGYNTQGGSVMQNGFTVTDTSGTNSLTSISPNPSIFNYTGSTALFKNAFQGLTLLTQDNGEAFAINSIDIANLGLQSSFFATTTVVFTGNVQGGGTVTQTFTSAPNDSLQTVTFGSAFTNLTSLTFDQEFPSNQFDNIVVTPSAIRAVPEPGSVALLAGMSLSGAGFLARRRKNARQAA